VVPTIAVYGCHASLSAVTSRERPLATCVVKVGVRVRVRDG
jgi:hypothetical protein